MATDSLIGYVSATIAAPAATGDSLIGFVPVTVTSYRTMYARQSGAWVPKSAQKRAGGSWYRVNAPQHAPAANFRDSLIGYAVVYPSYDPPVLSSRPAEGSIDAHTGDPIVYYETLYQSGDQVWQALNRASSPCVVSFPAGEFVLNDFKATERGSGAQTCSAVNLTKGIISGIIGMGRGDYNSATGTRFVVAENSSTWPNGTAGVTPTQAMGGTTQAKMFRSIDHTRKMHMANFRIQGSGQGHNFHGLDIGNCAGDILLENLIVAGWCGDNGAPPGETSGLQLSPSATTGSKLIVRNVVADGRYVNGTKAGSVGIHVLKALNAEITDCKAINTRIGASMVNYHTVNTTWTRCEMGSLNSPTGVGCYNGECNVNARLIDCTFGSTTGVYTHGTFSNADHTITIASTTYSTVNGPLTVIGGTWQPSNIEWGGTAGKLVIQSWTTGIDGANYDTQTTPPTVVDSSGHGLLYRWIHGGNHIDIQSPDITI